MRIFNLTLLFASLAVVSCNLNSKSKAEITTPRAIVEGETKMADVAVPPSNSNGAAATDTLGQHPSRLPQSPKEVEQHIDWDKKIVKTASVNLQVKNFRSFSDLLHADMKKYGAYVAQEEQNQSDFKVENIITIKVPVEQFDDLVVALTNGDVNLLEKKISSQDVTGELIDTRSRIESRKQVRLRYLDLLKQAKNMDEIITVQKEIDDIQEQIEAASGRVDFLDHSAAYSTINLTYFQVVNPAANDNQAPSYATRAWKSFKIGWSWVGDLLVGLISIWPLFLLGFGCLMIYRRWAVMKIQKKNA